MELQSNIFALQNKGGRKGQGKGETEGKGKPPRGALPKATPTEPPKGKGKTQSEENTENPQPQPAQQPPATWPNRTLDFRIANEMKGKGQGQGKGKGKQKESRAFSAGHRTGGSQPQHHTGPRTNGKQTNGKKRSDKPYPQKKTPTGAPYEGQSNTSLKRKYDLQN